MKAYPISKRNHKTDSVGASETAEAVLRYRLQGGAYAHALRQVTGKQVKEVVFLYLQPRREERLDGLAQAMQDAKEEAEALLDVAGQMPEASLRAGGLSSSETAPIEVCLIDRWGS